MCNRIILCFTGLLIMPVCALSQRVISQQIGPLPISWISFTAEAEGNSVLLQWTTTLDGKVALFTIERSKDAQEWDSIGTVQVVSESSQSQSVEFTDRLPLGGVDYYRVRRLSADDFVQYSAIAQVQVVQPRDYVVSPNPVVSNINVWLLSPRTKSVRVQVLSPDGRVVRQVDTQVTADQQNLRVDVGGVSAGLYFVNIIDDHGPHPQKVLIL